MGDAPYLQRLAGTEIFSKNQSREIRVIEISSTGQTSGTPTAASVPANFIRQLNHVL
jgi:hypothetical protein